MSKDLSDQVSVCQGMIPASEPAYFVYGVNDAEKDKFSVRRHKIIGWLVGDDGTAKPIVAGLFLAGKYHLELKYIIHFPESEEWVCMDGHVYGEMDYVNYLKMGRHVNIV